jgi:hypothetical protein
MKVPIDFAADFNSELPVPKPVGRLYLGPYCARISFTPKGHCVLAIDEEAVKSGFVILTKLEVPADGYGFGEGKQVKR